LPTFSNIRYYGITPLAIKEWFDKIGITENDTTISIDLLKSINRKYFKPNIIIYDFEKIESISYAFENITNKISVVFVDFRFKKFLNQNTHKIIKFKRHNKGLYKINPYNRLVKLLV
jgi:hypothetical protein